MHVIKQVPCGEAVSRDTPSLNPDLGQGQGQGQQSIVAGAQAALPDQVKRVMARASIDLTVLEDFQAKVPRPFAESTANVGDLITHIYSSGLAWIETAVVWLLQGNANR
ncbi:hypothetical protein WJX79_000284 [Trebouxia sp. C0005]